MSEPPRYRIEREASEDSTWQGLVNIVRRILRLPIKRTMQEVEEETLAEHGIERRVTSHARKQIDESQD